MKLDTTTYKQKLEEEKKLLVKELSSVGARQPRNPADWEAKEERSEETEDLNLAADRQEDIEERHALTDTLEARLAEVDVALKRMGEGKFGICEKGGEKIEEDRLEADPTAATCKKHMNDTE